VNQKSKMNNNTVFASVSATLHSLNENQMGIGFWDKLKNGFKKIGSGFKKVYEKVIKPVFNAIKPLAKPAVAALAAKYGGATGAALAEGAFEAVDAGINGKFGEAAAAGKRVIRQADPAKMPGWLRKVVGDT
jgi:hypothetical protein